MYQGERDNIIGTLMAKDLLKLQRSPQISVRALLRPAVFVPESKGLNDLLREFRGTRNHQAIVVDEFGRVAGLITIEDVIEQIVGEIEDEFDIAADDGDIFALADRTWRVSGDTPIERMNESFGLQLPEEDFDTIGGMIAESSFPAVLVPFIMAAILMTVCGSMTTAAMTAAGLMGGLMTVLGLDPVLTTLAIGAGSMVGWHVNNSGFWIFTSLYGFDTKQGLKYFTTTNALGGIVAFIVLVIIHAVGLV